MLEQINIIMILILIYFELSLMSWLIIIYLLFVDVVIKPEVSKSISIANELSTKNAKGGTSGFW